MQFLRYFEESREPRSIKIKPSILKAAHHRALEVNTRLGQWIEEAIEEKIIREEGDQNINR